MSRQIGMDAIHCRPTPRPAHSEYSMEYHSVLIRKVTGLDAGEESIARNAADYGFKPKEVRRHSGVRIHL